MADRVLFIGWGTPVRGREERALEVFNESVGLYGRMQQDGRIESFDVMLFGANTALGGCMLLRGDAAQIAGYLGRGEQFDSAIAKFAESYADQVENDHQDLLTAIARGTVRATVETD